MTPKSSHKNKGGVSKIAEFFADSKFGEMGSEKMFRKKRCIF
jgi:primase-polymerase (primpol)-like protein